MKMKKFGGTEKVVYDLVKPIADEQGYSIWDVSFEKEGWKSCRTHLCNLL